MNPPTKEEEETVRRTDPNGIAFESLVGQMLYHLESGRLLPMAIRLAAEKAIIIYKERKPL